MWAAVVGTAWSANKLYQIATKKRQSRSAAIVAPEPAPSTAVGTARNACVVLHDHLNRAIAGESFYLPRTAAIILCTSNAAHQALASSKVIPLIEMYMFECGHFGDDFKDEESVYFLHYIYERFVSDEIIAMFADVAADKIGIIINGYALPYHTQVIDDCHRLLKSAT